MKVKITIKKNTIALALGAESAGNFSIFKNGEIYLSKDFGDLLEEKNWKNFKKAVLKHLKDDKIKPEVVIADLHPLLHTTIWGQKLAQKYKARYFQIQHHHAHIFSSVGDRMLQTASCVTCPVIAKQFYGVTLDGTGYGLDGKIWGGEIFKIERDKYKVLSINRIGHLENQIMIGGDLSIREPGRMLIGILSKFLNKNEIYNFVKKYYSENDYELLYNQLQQKFNCIETSSAGRILDAVSLLLGFCQNERNYKHEPIKMLEKNSGKPYADLKPKIFKINGSYILNTNYLFNYVINYLHKKDKGRLGATAQLYIAKGFWEIIKKTCHPEFISGSKNKKMLKPTHQTSRQVQYGNIFISGGLSKNKIISDYLISKGAYRSKKVPLGDAGLSFGQIICYLLN